MNYVKDFLNKPFAKLLMYTVIGGPSSQNLAKKLAKRLDSNYVPANIQVFPDGESKITIPKIKGKIIIVNSTFPPVDSNLIQTFCLISQAKKYASEVIVIVPYLGYLRQDVEFLPGEIVTSAVIAKSIAACGATRVITVDAHSEIALGYFDIPVINASAITKLALYFKRFNLNDPLIVAVDFFWSANAKKFADVLSTDSIALNKQRDKKTGHLKIIPSMSKNLKGRDIILVDDMISTGNSIVLATKYLKKQNCGNIYACCTHGLLVKDSDKRIHQEGIKDIICTNTIPNKNSVVDVSDVLFSALSL